MKPIASLCALALALACAACFRNETTHCEIAVPEMTTEQDAQRVREKLSPMVEKGTVKDLKVDFAERKVVCSFNNRELGECNLLHAIAVAGYDANDWKALPADRAARDKALFK